MAPNSPGDYRHRLRTNRRSPGHSSACPRLLSKISLPLISHPTSGHLLQLLAARNTGADAQVMSGVGTGLSKLGVGAAKLAGKGAMSIGKFASK